MAIEIRLKQKPSNTQYAPLAVLSAYYLQKKYWDR